MVVLARRRHDSDDGREDQRVLRCAAEPEGIRPGGNRRRTSTDSLRHRERDLRAVNGRADEARAALPDHLRVRLPVFRFWPGRRAAEARIVGRRSRCNRPRECDAPNSPIARLSVHAAGQKAKYPLWACFAGANPASPPQKEFRPMSAVGPDPDCGLKTSSLPFYPRDRTPAGRPPMSVSCQSSMVLDKSKRGCKTALVTKPGGNDEDRSSRPDAVGPCRRTAGCGPRLCRGG